MGIFSKIGYEMKHCQKKVQVGSPWISKSSFHKQYLEDAMPHEQGLL